MGRRLLPLAIVPPPVRAYLVRRRVLLRLSSKATFPRGLNSLEGSCPCLGSRARVYGAHLAIQAREDQTAFTVLAAPPTLFPGRYRSRRGRSLLERRRRNTRAPMTEKHE